jgi:hypothetical protein
LKAHWFSESAGWRRGAFAGLALLITGCSAVGITGPTEPTATTSVETIEYYPYLVKGYQNSFPHRTMIVLIPTDVRNVSGPNAAPNNGQPAVGVVTDQSGNVVQHLYSAPLDRIVQGALQGSAAEAGFQPSSQNQSTYIGGEKKEADYIMASRITECWVKKHRGPDGRFGPTWSNEANFRVEVTIYKPPFKVPFWQGSSSQEYWDPPIGSFGLGPDDEAGIYDQPGQVLSVAMTRAVAVVFERDDLRALVHGDHMTMR